MMNWPSPASSAANRSSQTLRQFSILQILLCGALGWFSYAIAITHWLPQPDRHSLGQTNQSGRVEGVAISAAPPAAGPTRTAAEASMASSADPWQR